MEKNENYGKTKTRWTTPHKPKGEKWKEVEFINGYRMFIDTDSDPNFLRMKMISKWKRKGRANWWLSWHKKEDRLCRTKDSAWFVEHNDIKLLEHINGCVRGWLSEHKEEGHAEDDR